jgi:hypothetical protein
VSIVLVPPADPSKRAPRAATHRRQKACTGLSRARCLAESALQAFFNELLLGPVNSRRADADIERDRLVGGLRIGREEDLSTLDLTCRGLTAAHQCLKLLPFVARQRHPITYVHGPFRSRRGSCVHHLATPIHRQAGPVPGLHPHVRVAQPAGARRSRLPALLLGDTTGSSPDDRYARTQRLDQPRPRPGSINPATCTGRKAPAPSTDQNLCGEVLS